MAASDPYVIASFAIWAGDDQYFEEVLRQVPADFARTLRNLDHFTSSDDILSISAGLQIRQVRQRRSEFERLSSDLRRRGLAVSPQPIVIQTQHLRGCIWRSGAREFNLRAYLTDLEHEEQLFSKVRSRSEVFISTEPQTGVEPSSLPRVDTRHGGAWAIPGNPFVQVAVGGLGHIEATLTWTETWMPASVEPLFNACHRLLMDLDAE